MALNPERVRKALEAPDPAHTRWLLSCSMAGNHAKELAASPAVEGIYHVSGRHPWLLCFRSPAEPSLFAHETALDLREIAGGPAYLTTSIPVFGLEDRPLASNETRLQSFVFIRPYGIRDARPADPSERLSAIARTSNWLIETQPAARGDWCLRRISAPRACGWWLLAEMLTEGVAGLSRLVSDLERSRMASSSKVVLVRFKDRDETVEWRRHPATRCAFGVVPDTTEDLRLAMVVRNRRTLLLRSPAEQVREIQGQLIREDFEVPDRLVAKIERQLGAPKNGGRYVWAGQTTHPNDYVQRVTLSPVSDGWQMKFVFLRAARRADLHAEQIALGPSPAETLRAALEGRLGVRANRIISHLFQVTGRFDFALMVWTTEAVTASMLESQLTDLPIEGRPMILACRLPAAQAIQSTPRMDLAHCAVALALLRNAQNPEDFLEEVRGWNRRDLDLPAVSPRLASVLHRIGARVEPGASEADATRDTHALPECFESLGMAPSWELDRNKTQSAFLRLRTRNQRQTRDLLGLVESMTGQSSGRTEISFDYWIGERPEIVGIARYAHLGQLERFLREVRGRCDRAEFHLILSQEGREGGFANLPAACECAPCVFPKMLAWTRTQGPVSLVDVSAKNCATCGLYTRKQTGLRRKIQPGQPPRTPSERARIMQHLRIGVLDLQLTAQHLRDMGSIPLESPQEWISQRGTAHPEFCPEEYALRLWSLIHDDRALGRCDIVVMPEYCVPLETFDVLLRMLRDQMARSCPRRPERLLVLGTHVDRRGYNVAPIVHDDGRRIEVYLQQKAERSSMERGHRFPPRWGTGSLILQTSFGNVVCWICADAYRTALAVDDIDLVLIPSFHDGAEQTLLANLRPLCGHPRIIAFANGAARTRRSRARDSASSAAMARESTPPVDTRSFIAWGNREGQEKCATDPRDLYTYGGRAVRGGALVAEIDAIEVDRQRGSVEHRAPRGVFPLHVDLWRHAHPLGPVPAIHPESLEAIAELAREASGSAIEDELILTDWQEAREVWARYAKR